MKGRVLGGDTGSVYITYQMDETSFTAQIVVRNFLPDVPHALGVQGDFAMGVKGTVIGQITKAIASLIGQQVAGIVVKLTRVSDLLASTPDCFFLRQASLACRTAVSGLSRIRRIVGAERNICRNGSSGPSEFASFIIVSRLSSRWRSAKSRSPEFR